MTTTEARTRRSSGSSRETAPLERSRVGSQKPRIRIVPESAACSDGDDAALLCSAYWFAPDKWQRELLWDWLARDERGRLCVITAGLSVPRQNGKNGALEALELYLLVTDGTTHILHTAHRVKTVKRAFNRLARVFTQKGSKWKPLRDMVEQIRRTNGEESITLTNGATIEYSARSKSGGRGFENITLVVYDEAQELTDDQLEAINATMSASASGDRQAIYTGTPPGPSVFGTVFRKMRSKALSDPSAHMSWHEWGIDAPLPRETTFADLEDAIYESNPAMGTRLDMEFTEEEFGTYSLEGFARERLGWWSEAAKAESAIPRDMWNRAAVEEIGNGYKGKRAMAVKFSPDGSRYALAGCKLNGKGNAAFELVELGDTTRGTRELARALVDRKGVCSVVVVDGLAAADALCSNLTEEGAPRGYVVRPRTGDVIAAAQGLHDALKEGTAVHSTADRRLEESALGATRRRIGSRGGWGFGAAAEGVDPCPIEACAPALWAARTTKRNPKRKQRML